MKNLPWLPFKKILGYLDLKTLIKSRAVSRAWRDCIDDFKAKDLCYSQQQRNYSYEENQ